MRSRFQLLLTMAVMTAVSSTLVFARAQDSSKGDSSPDERAKARVNKIEALTIKQKSAERKAGERRESEVKDSDSKSRAPISVNEPGVNRAAKPNTGSEEDVANQPTKGSKRVAEPPKRESPHEEKPGKGEPQPTKDQ